MEDLYLMMTPGHFWSPFEVAVDVGEVGWNF